MTTYREIHPAADAFPMMDAGRYAELMEDIRDHGLRVPIVLYEGMILDGRNRARACAELGIEPRFEEFAGDPWAYVWSMNGSRRDLDKGQRAIIREKIARASGAWAERQRAIQSEANQRRAEAAAARPRNPDGTLAPVAGNNYPSLVGGHPTREAKAREARVSTSTQKVAETLMNRRPDLADAIAAGEMRFTEGLRQMAHEEVRKKSVALPAGKYRVIYADPPWKYSDSKMYSGGDTTAAERHYPTMPTREICALGVRDLAADDCVLFCWATFPMLTDALEVVRAWGFQYKTAFVWDKQRHNLANYHNGCAELLLVATRGSGTPDASRREPQVVSVKRPGPHSAKPAEFRAMIDRMYTVGRRIELFARGAVPENWEAWGNEAPSAAQGGAA